MRTEPALWAVRSSAVLGAAAWDARRARLRSLLQIVVPAGKDVVADPRQIDRHRQPLCPFQPLDVVEMGGRLKVEMTDRPLQ